MKFSIYNPVTPFLITQSFGVNGDYYRTHGINIKGHNGYDLLAKHGQPVYASHDGQAYYEIDGGQGHGVVIRTTQTFDYEGGQSFFKTLYWHLCDSIKEPQFKSPVEPYTDLDGPGMTVKAGDLIGYADTTGFSTGDHLHFGIKPFLSNEQNGAYYNVAQQNGYLGAIDPTPYMNGLPPTSLKHTFYIDMKYGDENSEVSYLQRCLQSIGFFPKGTQITGYYGDITAKSVFDFDKQYAITGVLSFIAVWGDKGNHVGPLTKLALNKVFA